MILNVQGFTPYDKQKEWIQQIEEPSVKYITLCTGRQVGKTLLSQNLLLKWGLENNNQTIMFVSPVYSQARKVFTDIEKALAGTPLITSSNKSNYEMSFINGTKIIFRSSENSDSLRGYTLDYLICDEAAFIKDDVWNTILKPTILVRGKKVLFISTPKGKNWFYTLHTRGQDDSQKEYITLQASSYDNPYINKDELDEAKRTLPEDIFKQEILGQFIDTGGEVFTDIDRYCVVNNYTPKQSGKKYYAGIDFGRQNDYTALTIFNDDGVVVYMWRERQQEWSRIIQHLSNKLREYDAITLVEVNSIGDVLYEQLKQKYNKVEPFVTTNASKQNIVEDIIYATNEGIVKLPTEQLEPSLYRELRSFTYDYSIKTRKIQYKALQGQHDDMIMSLCIAYHALKQRKTKGVYHIY
jgi:phage FluMu gp28-like protein